MIYWTAFNWEAFATLVTGLAAVIAAGIIGWRQSQIQSRQVSLQEQELKVSILERRLQVYDAVREFLGTIEITGGPPDQEKLRNFLQAKGRAKFLFSPELNGWLDEIWDRHRKFKTAYSRQRLESSDDDSRMKQFDLAEEASTWLSDAFSELDKKFSDITPVK